MHVLDAIEQRRAVKYFDPNHQMTDAEKSKLLETARLSPTAFNIQNWRFVVVEDKQQRTKIRKAAWDQAQVTDASMLIILCADLKSWEKNPQRYWRFAPQAVQDFMIPAITSFYSDREWMQRDEAIRSTGIAAQTLMLAAKAMGYDSCPMDGFDPDQVAKLINLPDDHIVSMMVAVGKALQPAGPRSGPVGEKDAVIYDRFGA